ncbi:hypothetical protein JBE27_51845, partial [Streptomyces albiflaviniger]|nr:hypothetical protein [Streptomyces albiflaviniger]
MDSEKRKQPLARRRVLALTAGSLVAAGCTQGERRSADKTGQDPEARTSADRPDGALGANFNEDPDSVTFGELRELSASWLRGFVPMPEVEDDASRQRAIAKLLDAHRLGH